MKEKFRSWRVWTMNRPCSWKDLATDINQALRDKTSHHQVLTEAAPTSHWIQIHLRVFSTKSGLMCSCIWDAELKRATSDCPSNNLDLHPGLHPRCMSTVSSFLRAPVFVEHILQLPPYCCSSHIFYLRMGLNLWTCTELHQSNTSKKPEAWSDYQSVMTIYWMVINSILNYFHETVSTKICKNAAHFIRP